MNNLESLFLPTKRGDAFAEDENSTGCADPADEDTVLSEQ